MRFHPKSRASSDQRPGPNMASAAAMVAAKRGAKTSPDVGIWGELNPGDGHSSQGCPQPGDKEKPRSSKREEGQGRIQRWVGPQQRAGTDEEDGPHDQAHEEQPDTRPTARECGIKAPRTS